MVLTGFEQCMLQLQISTTIHGFEGMSAGEIYDPFLGVAAKLRFSATPELGTPNLAEYKMPGLPLIHSESPVPLERGNLVFILHVWQGVLSLEKFAQIQEALIQAYPKQQVFVFVG